MNTFAFNRPSANSELAATLALVINTDTVFWCGALGPAHFSSEKNSPQTPLVHGDVPVLPEICHRLRVPGGRARQTPHESTKALNNGSSAA